MSASCLSRIPCVVLALAAMLVAAPVPAIAQGLVPIALRNIQREVLPNGLEVVLAPDASVDYVAVELFFRSGTRLDPPGARGQSHLFEHLFSSSGRVSDSATAALGRGRVADSNAQTRRDYVRYFLKVVPEALDYAVAMQASRMRLTSSVITDSAVARHAAVVVNEGGGTRSTDGPPSAYWLLQQGTYPLGHPYHLIPEAEASVRAVTAEGLRAWLVRYHTPREALLVVSGRFTPDSARTMIRRRFDMPAASASPALRVGALMPAPAPVRRASLFTADSVSRVTRRFAVPPLGDASLEMTEVALRMIAERWAVDAGAALRGVPVVSVEPGELASDLSVSAEVVAPAAAARALDAAIRRVAGHALPAAVNGAAAQARVALLRRLERLGFQNSRNEQLAEATLIAGDPWLPARRLDRFTAATVATVTRAAQAWLLDRGYELTEVGTLLRDRRETAAPLSAFGATSAPPDGPRAGPVSSDTVVRSVVGGVPLLVAARAAAPVSRLTVAILGANTDAELDAVRAVAAAWHLRAGFATMEVAPARWGIRLTAVAEASRGPILLQSLGMTHLAPRAAVVVWSGAVSPRDTATLKSAVAAWAVRSPPAAPMPTFVTPGLITVAAAGRSQVRIVAQWRLAAGTVEEWQSVRIARRTLSVALNDALRTQRGWSYGVQGTVAYDRDGAVLTMTTEVQEDRIADAMKVVEQTIRAHTDGLSNGSIVAALARTLALEALGEEELLSDAEATLIDGEQLGRAPSLLRRVSEHLMHLTSADVARAESRVRWEQAQVTVTGDPASLRRLAP